MNILKVLVFVMMAMFGCVEGKSSRRSTKLNNCERERDSCIEAMEEREQSCKDGVGRARYEAMEKRCQKEISKVERECDDDDSKASPCMIMCKEIGMDKRDCYEKCGFLV
mgnify:CR=1 FL=1